MTIGSRPTGTFPIATSPASGGVNYQITSARITFAGFTPAVTITIPEIRVSWYGAEVMHGGAAQVNVSWIGLEALHNAAAAARLSWIGLEVLRSITTQTSDSGFVSIIW